VLAVIPVKSALIDRDRVSVPAPPSTTSFPLKVLVELKPETTPLIVSSAAPPVISSAPVVKLPVYLSSINTLFSPILPL